ncbi:MAG: 50S ribosomal protein L29 [Proteobacteria bacterium]|nr:50S ribosomal protein L29 [Pseudomonadota bacterium]
MKPAEIRERSTEELVELEGQLKRDLWRARLDNFSNQLDETSKIGRIRRDVARVKTVLSERLRQQAAEATEESHDG